MTEQPEAPRVEPVDTLHAALDATMPALADLDPDWQSRWSTASLLLNELEQRGWTLALSQEGPQPERYPEVNGFEPGYEPTTPPGVVQERTPIDVERLAEALHATGDVASGPAEERLREWIGEANGASYALDLLSETLAEARAAAQERPPIDVGRIEKVLRRQDALTRIRGFRKAAEIFAAEYDRLSTDGEPDA